MQLIPAKNYAKSFKKVIAGLEENSQIAKCDHQRESVSKTIELLYFLQNKVAAPSQWFVISLSALIVIVANETYYGRANDVKLRIWASEEGLCGCAELEPAPDGWKQKEVILLDSKKEAKVFLENFFGSPLEP